MGYESSPSGRARLAIHGTRTRRLSGSLPARLEPFLGSFGSYLYARVFDSASPEGTILS